MNGSNWTDFYDYTAAFLVFNGSFKTVSSIRASIHLMETQNRIIFPVTFKKQVTFNTTGCNETLRETSKSWNKSCIIIMSWRQWLEVVIHLINKCIAKHWYYRRAGCGAGSPKTSQAAGSLLTSKVSASQSPSSGPFQVSSVMLLTKSQNLTKTSQNTYLHHT